MTSYALYFESLGVGVYDKAVRYDLATDTKQVLKPELTGPLGARLFDRAVMYKSASVYVYLVRIILRFQWIFSDVSQSMSFVSYYS